EPRLEEVPRVIALTKADLLEDVVDLQREALEAHLGRPVHVISAETGQGVDALLSELMDLVAAERERAEQAEPEEIGVLRPESQQRFEVIKLGDGRFEVEGKRIVSFVQMMDTDMEGARGEV